MRENELESPGMGVEEVDDEVIGAELRALRFQLLALCFSYPSEETQRAERALMQRVGDLWLFSQQRAQHGSNEIKAALSHISGNAGICGRSDDKLPQRSPEGVQISGSADGRPRAESDLQERQMAYLRTFKRVALYESEYTAKHALLPTDNIADVAGFYRAFGFQVREGGDRADHIAAELQFMALVALKELVARNNGEADKVAICLEAQKKFLAEHLGPFLIAFEENLAEYAKQDEGAAEWLNAVRAARALAEEVAAKWNTVIAAPERASGVVAGALGRGVEAETLECPFAPPGPEDAEN